MKSLAVALLILIALARLSQAGVVVVGDLSRSASVGPGDAFEGVILVRNPDAQPAEVKVFQTDYSFRADGSTVYGEPGKGTRSNATWITVTPKQLRIASGETVPVRYKGRVPTDTNLRGSYWSLIMIEPNTTPAITPEGKPNKIAVGLQTAVRFGIQILCDVGHAGTSSLQILHKAVVKDAKQTYFQLDIGNDGERMLIPTTTIELFDQVGNLVRRVDGGRARIYPGCSVRTVADLTGLPLGTYAAMVLLDSGDAQVMGAQYELEITPDTPLIEQPTLVGEE